MRNKTWRPERAVGIADALDQLLGQIEHEIHHDPVCAPRDLLPRSTGLVGLDRVCDGGLYVGTVTVLDCPLASHSRAILYSAARATDLATLLAVEHLGEATRWLLSGAANVPAGLIRELQLSEADWAAITGALQGLGHRDLTLAEAPSLAGVGHLARQTQPRILILDDPGRLGPVDEVVADLVHLARSTGTAVLTATSGLPEVPEWLAEDIVRVSVAPHTLGSGATLVTTGGAEGLSTAQIQIDMLIAAAT